MKNIKRYISYLLGYIGFHVFGMFRNLPDGGVEYLEQFAKKLENENRNRELKLIKKVLNENNDVEYKRSDRI